MLLENEKHLQISFQDFIIKNNGRSEQNKHI